MMSVTSTVLHVICLSHYQSVSLGLYDQYFNFEDQKNISGFHDATNKHDGEGLSL